MSRARGQLTIAELVAMPHLGLALVAGSDGADRAVQWTHTSELEDPGPWLEGGELLIVNGFGVPEDTDAQVRYLRRLAQHRLAGIAVSVRAPELTEGFLREADRLGFPVLRIPREVPFIELSYLVAGASERSARSRLARHLRIFETLRLRNDGKTPVAVIYSLLEQITGYRIALLNPAGKPLVSDWGLVPDSLDPSSWVESTDLQVIPRGYVLPLVVDNRVTAYLVAIERDDAVPEGLAAIQHVSSLAALDALDDQRQREVEHRRRSVLFAQTLESTELTPQLALRFADFGFSSEAAKRVVIFAPRSGAEQIEIEVRDWLMDREIPHLMLARDDLSGIVECSDAQFEQLAGDLDLVVGASTSFHDLGETRQRQRQARWSIGLAGERPAGGVVFAEAKSGILQWLHPDRSNLEHLAEDTLRPLIEYDSANNTELVFTLAAYFRHHGKLRATAAQLFLHEHTLAYRIKRIEQITRRNLKEYPDAFELWLAVEARSLR